jgi:hypothetical protein
MKVRKITLKAFSIVLLVAMVFPSVLLMPRVRAEGELIFAEDFDSAENIEANWSPYGSAFSVSDSIGTLFPDGSVAPIWSNHRATIHDKGNEPIIFQDLEYAVNVKLTPAIRTMLCFGQDSEGRRMWVGYDIGSIQYGWNNDLEDSDRGAGNLSVLEDYRPYDWQWHRWRIEVIGSQFDFWIDSHHIITGQLEGYLPGPIGMRSWDAGGTQFDNLVALSEGNDHIAPTVSSTNPPLSTPSPTPKSTATPVGLSVVASGSVTFEVPANLPVGNGNFTYDFGDGTNLTTSERKVTHVYENPGNYTFMLKIEGASENGVVETYTVTVTNPSENPLIRYTWPIVTSMVAGLSVAAILGIVRRRKKHTPSS